MLYSLSWKHFICHDEKLASICKNDSIFRFENKKKNDNLFFYVGRNYFTEFHFQMCWMDNSWWPTKWTSTWSRYFILSDNVISEPHVYFLFFFFFELQNFRENVNLFLLLHSLFLPRFFRENSVKLAFY